MGWGEWNLGSFACGRWEGTLAFLLADRDCSAGVPDYILCPQEVGTFQEVEIRALYLGCSVLALLGDWQAVSSVSPLYLWLKRAQQKGHGR